MEGEKIKTGFKLTFNNDITMIIFLIQLARVNKIFAHYDGIKIWN